MTPRLAALLLVLLVAASACSEESDDPIHSDPPPPCDGVYGRAYTECENRALYGECAGWAGFALLMCIGNVCNPEAHRAVFDCCARVYPTQEEIQACYEAMAPTP